MPSTGTGVAQIWGIGILLFACFLNFVIVIRNYNHISFFSWNEIDQATYLEDPEAKKKALAHAETLIKRATIHTTIGTRCFYAIAMVLGWRISTGGMLGASILLVAWIAYNDIAG